MKCFRCTQSETSNDPLSNALVELSQQPKKLPEPITVPYLNPLVLLKELESVLGQEGDSCLTNYKFIQEHPIVYWNLIWFYERINLSSHLPELWLDSDEKKDDRCGNVLGSVGVRTMWDNERLHLEKLPMHLQWRLTNTEDRT